MSTDFGTTGKENKSWIPHCFKSEFVDIQYTVRYKYWQAKQ